MAERVRVREISNEEGNRLLRIVRRSSGSVVTWRRAQMVLLSAQGMDVPQIAKVAFTSLDRVREVVHNFNEDGFDSLYPRYAGGAAGSSDPRARDPWPERDAALFAVFAGAGVRIGEAIAMTMSTVEAAERSPRLRVLGKGNKPRVIPVGPEVITTIDDYLATRRERVGNPSPTDPLFVRRVQGGYVAFNRQAMDGLVSGWYRRAAVTPPPGSLAHALRHTYATLLVDAGASLPEVQRLLGHADLSTTQVYLKVAGRGLEEAALSNPSRALLGRRPSGAG